MALAIGGWTSVSAESAARSHLAYIRPFHWPTPAKRRDTAKKQIASGIDPAAKRKLEKITAALGAENTFRAIAEEWLTKLAREGRAEATLDKTRWLLSFAYAAIGDRPIAQITAPELLIALRRIEARGRFETARRLRSTCGQVFRYAIATGRAERDPSADLRGALTIHKVHHRPAIIDPKAIGALLRAIDGFEGKPTTKAALQLAALTFVRPGELRRAEWCEFDLDIAEWRIPAEKMKMRRPHRVALARQAIAILRDLQKITGDGKFVFPSVRTVRRPMSENTLNAALRRLGYSKDEMTTHGFRSTATVRLNEMGLWNPDAIERQLAHQETDDVRRARKLRRKTPKGGRRSLRAIAAELAKAGFVSGTGKPYAATAIARMLATR